MTDDQVHRWLASFLKASRQHPDRQVVEPTFASPEREGPTMSADVTHPRASPRTSHASASFQLGPPHPGNNAHGDGRTVRHTGPR